MTEKGSKAGRYGTLAALGFVWLALFGLFSVVAPQSFPTIGNVETLTRQTAIVGFAAIGMTFVIIGGAVDLSVGSVVAFVTVVIAWFLERGYPPLLAAMLGLLGGAACGLLNGALVTRLRVSPFIVTLGSLLVVRGAAKGLAHEQKIDAAMTWLSQLLATLSPPRRWMLLPPGVWMLAITAVLASVVLTRTVFGRRVFAVGSNETAARFAGLNVSRQRVLVFVVMGLCAGLAGLMQFSRLTVGDPTVAVGLELDVIAAVVIGGASLSGGEGSIAGSLLGAVIMATIRAGCSQAGLPNWVQEMVTGAIIVAAVTLDRMRASRYAKAA